MPEARQEKFAASVSQLFQSPKTIQASIAEPVISTSEPLQAMTPDKTVGSVAEKHSELTVKNSAASLFREAVNTPEIPVTISIDQENSSKDISAVSEANERNIQTAGISTISPKDPLNVPKLSFIGGSSMSSKNPFDHIIPINEDRSFLQRSSFTVRFGGGKAPGNEQAYTGSLFELKASTEILDWLVAKISVGQFMPYETQAVSAGFNSDKIKLLQLSPVLQYRNVVGAEIGGKFTICGAPFELSAGTISDLQGHIIPRGGFFTSLMLQDNLDMNIGLEAMLYQHNILPSLQNNQNNFSSQHPSLIGELRGKEMAGFLGPSVELTWHF
jgi:hypothetical protein